MAITPKKANAFIRSWRTTIGGLLSLASVVCAFIPGAQAAVPILVGLGGALTGVSAADHKTATKDIESK